jgi:hypothetical protein
MNNGVWTEYNDDIVTEDVNISQVYDKAYYYCYRQVVSNYVEHIENLA